MSEFQLSRRSFLRGAVALSASALIVPEPIRSYFFAPAGGWGGNWWRWEDPSLPDLIYNVSPVETPFLTASSIAARMEPYQRKLNFAFKVHLEEVIKAVYKAGGQAQRHQNRPQSPRDAHPLPNLSNPSESEQSLSCDRSTIQRYLSRASPAPRPLLPLSCRRGATIIPPPPSPRCSEHSIPPPPGAAPRLSETP